MLTVVSPFNKNALLVFVPTVGIIVTALIPAPLTVTPAGTVSGNISSYVPGKITTVSPAVA